MFVSLLGPYVPEGDAVKPRCGLVKPILSNNPLRVWFTGWFDLLRDLASARSLREALGYIAMPPGWRPGQPVPRAEREAVEVSQP